LFAALKKLSRNSLHIWWRNSSCCRKMVLRTAWLVLQWQVKKTFLVLTVLYRTRGRLSGKMN
jgi:hypothetical protein